VTRFAECGVFNAIFHQPLQMAMLVLADVYAEKISHK
jgi:hypothetical protein